MGGFGSIWHWVIVAVIVVVLFGGRGKISDLMGDFAKGIKAFKKGMSDDEDEKPAQGAPVAGSEPVRTLPHQANEPSSVSQPSPAATDRKAV